MSYRLLSRCVLQLINSFAGPPDIFMYTALNVLSTYPSLKPRNEVPNVRMIDLGMMANEMSYVNIFVGVCSL